MLTPIEILNAQHKTGRGYSKREMDEFLDDVATSYEALYKQNIELENKISKLTSKIDYYKSMETTLQKALVLAEKTSKDTIDTAKKEAEVITKQAGVKAEQIISQASVQCDATRQKCIQLIQQYNQFKMQFKQIAIKQIDLLESDFYDIYSNDLTASINEAIDNTDETVNKAATDSAEPEPSDSESAAEDINSADTKDIPYEDIKNDWSEDKSEADISEKAEDKSESDVSEKTDDKEESDASEKAEDKFDNGSASENKMEFKTEHIAEYEPLYLDNDDTAGKMSETGNEPEKTFYSNESDSDKKDIPPVDMESIDALLKDIKRDFAARQEELKNENGDSTQFEFLDNE